MTRHHTTGLVLDFDGTIMKEDVGNAICDRFASPRWRDVNDQYLEGRLSIFEAQQEMWDLVSATEQAIEAFLGGLERRRGFVELLERASKRDIPIVIASGGFEWYIQRLLGSDLRMVDAVYANRLSFDSAGKIRPQFPHLDQLGCHRCAVCKARVIERFRSDLGSDSTIIFAGDGASDQCAVTHADRVYTVRGSSLARFCSASGIAHAAFDTFDSVALI